MPGNKRERKVAKGKLATFFMHMVLSHFVNVLSHCGYGNWAWLCITIVMQELYIIYLGRNGGKTMSDICVIIKPASGQCNMKCEYCFYADEMNNRKQYIACLAPINAKPDAVDYSVSPDAYGDFLIALFDLWENDFWNGTQPYIRQFENYIGILLGIEPESCEQKGVCGFQMIVEADGSVYPCDFYVLDAYKLGHLSVDDFDSLGQAGKRVDFVKRSYNHAQTCLKCEYHFICRGGCCRNREQFGEVYGRNIFCTGYRKFFEHSLERMKRIAEWVKITRGDYLWNC